MTPYEVAVRLYPRAFREEYGEDLLALAEDLRAELGRPRAALRLTGDLLASLPARHLETLVKRPAPVLVPLLATGLGVVLVLLAVVLGTAAGVGILVIAMLSGVVAALAYPGSHVVREGGLASRWWVLLLVGGVLHGLVAGGQVLFDNDSELLWPLAFVGVVGGWACLVAGVVLAVVHLVRRRPATG